VAGAEQVDGLSGLPHGLIRGRGTTHRRWIEKKGVGLMLVEALKGVGRGLFAASPEKDFSIAQQVRMNGNVEQKKYF
jgi:hypothetical protein